MTASINANLTTGVVVTSDTSGALALQTGGTTALTVDSSQNVGIGTSSPAQKLDVSKTQNAETSIVVRNTSTGAAGKAIIRFGNDNGDNVGSVGALSSGFTPSGELEADGFYVDAARQSLNLSSSNNGIIKFFGAGTERMRIASSGYVYFGTTTNVNNGAMIVQQASNGTGITVNGVNNTSGAVFMYFTEAGANCGYIQRVGTTSAVVYSTSSDYRLKENIAPITNALNTVARLKPVTYDWKAGGSSQGFIAHELQEVLPDAVTGEKDQVNEDGSINAQGIDQSRIVATLTAAIQELSAKVDAQALEIQALKGASA